MKYITIQKDLKCKECGYIFPIHRKLHKNHKAGHIKHMYCPSCRKVTEHIEMSKEDIYNSQPIYREIKNLIFIQN